MSEHEDPLLKFGIDRLVTNGRRIFGWGWVAHPAHAIEEVALQLEGDGWQKRLPVHFGLVRADVERAHPSLKNAGASGFVVAGYPPPHPARKLVLEVRLEAARPSSSTSPTRWNRVRKAAGSGASSSGSRGRPAGACAAATSAASCGARGRRTTRRRPLDDLEAARRLVPTLRAGEPSYVVFDHNMGGGANQYRRQWIAEHLAGGAAVLLCTYNLPTLDYRLEVLRPGGGEEIYRLSSFLGLDPSRARR